MILVRRRLPFSTNVLYGVGSLAYGLKLQALGTVLLLYFNQVVGLPATWVGLVLMVALIMDAIQDPLIGQWSDNFRSRWGRRHPFMYASALPAAVAFYFLWRPPAGWSHLALTAYLFVCLATLRFVISFYETPSAALGPELAPDYDERTRLLSYRYFFQSIGGLAMTALTYMVFLRPTAKYPTGILNPAGYREYGLVGGAIIFFAILISTAGTHREIPYLTVPKARRFRFGAMFAEMFATLSNRNFLVLTVAVLISAVALGVAGALNLYINSYFWELPPQSIAYVVGVGIISTVVGVVLAPHVARRFEKKPVVIVSAMCGWVLSTWPLVAGLMHATPPSGSTALLVMLIVNNGLTSVFSTIGAIGGVSMLADVIEESQVQTGRRSEGLLMSADNLVQKSIAGFGIFLSGVLLTLIHFPANAVPGHIDPAIVRKLVLFYLPVTSVLNLFAVISLSFYRIDRRAHEANLRLILEAALVEGPEALTTGATPD